jgi:hypothetical protein
LALIFIGLLFLHAPLLRLPYFWDEAGYYVPATRDLYLTGALVPSSTPSKAHPPLVMAWLALAWRVAGFSPVVTRTAMVAVAALALLSFFRLARTVTNLRIAWAATIATALYPVFFTQSSLAQLDLPAAGLAFLGLLAYVEDSPVRVVVWFSLSALAKETAILAPLGLAVWELLARVIRPRWNAVLPPAGRKVSVVVLLLPLGPLAGWYGYHYMKTGYLLGNPEYFRYNVRATLSLLRIPIALGLRLWQVFGYFGLYLLTTAGLLAMLRPPATENGNPRPRIALWVQGAFLSVLLAYLGFLSIVGGAGLARYMLPVVSLVMLVWISTLWRRVRYWSVVVGAVLILFVTGLFDNPPYGFSLEDNLAYRDFVVMHVEASRFLAMRYPGGRVLTAWPASDELTQPWLGYVSQPFPVVRLEDFTPAEINRAAARRQFDVAFVFSTKYVPAHPALENWQAWQRIKARFFGYHRDVLPGDIATRLGGKILFHQERQGQWIAVIGMEGSQETNLMDCPTRKAPSLSSTSASSCD